MTAHQKRIKNFHTVLYLLPNRVFITTLPYARRNALTLTARKTRGGYYTDLIPLFGRWPGRKTVDLIKYGKRIKNLARYGLVETSRPEIVSAYFPTRF